MLKVIAEDFIKPEQVETVAPLYRELVEQTRREPLCISYDLFVDKTDPAISSSSSNGPIAPRSTRIARRSISPAWCRRSTPTSGSLPASS